MTTNIVLLLELLDNFWLIKPQGVAPWRCPYRNCLNPAAITSLDKKRCRQRLFVITHFAKYHRVTISKKEAEQVLSGLVLERFKSLECVSCGFHTTSQSSLDLHLAHLCPFAPTCPYHSSDAASSYSES